MHLSRKIVIFKKFFHGATMPTVNKKEWIFGTSILPQFFASRLDLI
jgi:threonine/homoserine/homoserine lactone efflux protein